MSTFKQERDEAAEAHFKDVYFPQGRNELWWMRTTDFKFGYEAALTSQVVRDMAEALRFASMPLTTPAHQATVRELIHTMENDAAKCKEALAAYEAAVKESE